jgi:hypothetical protein
MISDTSFRKVPGEPKIKNGIIAAEGIKKIQESKIYFFDLSINRAILNPKPKTI